MEGSEVRKAFEKWADEHIPYSLERIEKGDHAGEYDHRPMQCAWESWLAALTWVRLTEAD